jgi:hypothetical protein
VWHEEGVDFITKNKHHSEKLRASWKPAEVNFFNHLRFIIDHIICKADGNQNNTPRVLQELDAKKDKRKIINSIHKNQET